MLVVLLLIFLILLTLLIIDVGKLIVGFLCKKYDNKSLKNLLNFPQKPLLSSITPNVQFTFNNDPASAITFTWDEDYIFRMNFIVNSGVFDQNNTYLQIVKPGRLIDKIIYTFTYAQLSTTDAIQVFLLNTPGNFGTTTIKHFGISTGGTPNVFSMNESSLTTSSYVTVNANGASSNDSFTGYIDISPKKNNINVVIGQSNFPLTTTNQIVNGLDQYYISYYNSTNQILYAYATV